MSNRHRDNLIKRELKRLIQYYIKPVCVAICGKSPDGLLIKLCSECVVAFTVLVQPYRLFKIKPNFR